MLARYAKERNPGERFGDWCDRVLLEQQRPVPSRGQLSRQSCFKMTADQIAKANAELRNKSPLEIVRWAVAQAKGRALVSTNFRPYEAVILHLCVQVQPDIPVLWVDHGYNRPATYQARRGIEKTAQAESETYLPKISAAHRDAIYGDIPSTDDEAGLKQFSALMKLEPFQRGMKELAPTVWITALRKVQNPNRAELDIVAEDKNFGALRSVRFFIGPTRTWKIT